MSRRVIDLLKYLEKEVAGISRFLRHEPENSKETTSWHQRFQAVKETYKIARRAGRRGGRKEVWPLFQVSFEVDERIDRLASLSVDLSERNRKNFGEDERLRGGRMKRATYVTERQYASHIDLTFASTAIRSTPSGISRDLEISRLFVAVSRCTSEETSLKFTVEFLRQIVVTSISRGIHFI